MWPANENTLVKCSAKLHLDYCFYKLPPPTQFHFVKLESAMRFYVLNEETSIVCCYLLEFLPLDSVNPYPACVCVRACVFRKLVTDG